MTKLQMAVAASAAEPISYPDPVRLTDQLPACFLPDNEHSISMRRSKAFNLPNNLTYAASCGGARRGRSAVLAG